MGVAISGTQGSVSNDTSMASGSLGQQFSTTKRSLRGNTLDRDICLNIVLNSCYEILDVMIIENKNNSQSFTDIFNRCEN